MTDNTLPPARPLQPRRLELVIALLIFALWTGFLAWIYFTKTAG